MNGEGFAFFRWVQLDTFSSCGEPGWQCLGCRYLWRCFQSRDGDYGDMI